MAGIGTMGNSEEDIEMGETISFRKPAMISKSAPKNPSSTKLRASLTTSVPDIVVNPGTNALFDTQGPLQLPGSYTEMPALSRALQKDLHASLTKLPTIEMVAKSTAVRETSKWKPKFRQLISWTITQTIMAIATVWALVVGNSISQVGTLARAGRAARISARAGRIARMVRLIRLVRVANLFQVCKRSKQKVEDFEVDIKVGDEQFIEPSRAGKKLIDLTTRKVVMLVLLMLLATSLLTLDVEYDEGAKTLGVQSLQLFNESERSLENPSLVKQLDLLKEFSENTPLMQLILGIDKEAETGGVTLVNNEALLGLRIREVAFVSVDDGPFHFSEAQFSIVAQTKHDAEMSLYQTLFICLLLGFGNWLFLHDATRLVIHPLERMTSIVRKLAHDPLAKLKIATQTTDQETTKLLTDVKKLGSLLQISFGEAGAKIVANNLDTSTGGVDVMQPGTKVNVVMGFCDIRRFTDATEHLREDVYLFVNQIAKSLHTIVHHHEGFANKNIGDAWLLLWKWDKARGRSTPIPMDPSLAMSRAVDQALISFLLTVEALEQDDQLKEIASKIDIPEYEVKLGFGLHIGWAVEGAIGSKYKIDASYLSPHVNLAARLEAATKQFGVTILMSGEFASLLSTNLRRRCRMIDRVTVKGSRQPMRLFTCSMGPLETAEDGEEEENEFSPRPVMPQLSSRMVGENDSFNMLGVEPMDLWDLVFEAGVAQYVEGNWDAACPMINHALQERPNDRPTQLLHAFMSSRGWKAPANWAGYRGLTEK